MERVDEQLTILKELRNRVESNQSAFGVFLGELKRLAAKKPNREEEGEGVAKILRSFDSSPGLSRIATIEGLIVELRNNQSLNLNSKPSLTSIPLKHLQRLQAQFRLEKASLDSLISEGLAGDIFSYLSISLDSIDQEITKLGFEAKKETEPQETQTNEKQKTESNQRETDEQKDSSDDKDNSEAKIREQKRELTIRAKTAYLEYKKRFSNEINAILDKTHAFEEVDNLNYAELVEISTILPVNTDQNIKRLFEIYGLSNHFQGNEAALDLAIKSFKEMRNLRRTEMASNNQSTNVFSSSDPIANNIAETGLIKLASKVGSQEVVTAMTTKPSILRAAAEQEPGNEPVRLHDRITNEFILDLAKQPENENTFLSIFKSFSPEMVDQNLQTIQANDDSIVDIVGEPDSEDEPRDEAVSRKTKPSRFGRRKPTPKDVKKKAEQLKRTGQLADTLAKNPMIAGAAGAALGTVVSGLMMGVGTLPYAAAGGLAGAWGGAQIGAAIGTVAGPIGSLVGGVVGAFVGGLGGAFGGGWLSTKVPWFNGENLASATGKGIFGVGNAAPKIGATISQTAGASASTVASTLPPISSVLGAGSSAITGVNTGITALSHLPSLFSGALGTSLLVVAPVAVCAVVTVSILIPGAISPYLSPLNGSGGAPGGINGVGGCWPATGLLEQGPFDQGKVGTHNYISGANRILLDAVDIGGKMGEPIFAPFAGSISFYNQDTGTYAGGKYGNYALLHTDTGKELLFAHFSNFFLNLIPGGSYQVTAGEQIGYMGDSETQLVDTSGLPIPGSNVHVHYEAKPTISQLSVLPLPATSVMDSIAPEPIIYASQWVVPVTQQVSSSVCSGGVTASGSGTITPHSGPIKGTVGCFKFEEGSQTWGHTVPDELATYMSEMTKELSDPRVDKAICGHGDVRIVRTKSDAPDGGCLLGSGSSAGAVTYTDRSILVCDKVFSDPSGFGTSTMWHEPGHIVQQNKITGNFTWEYYFKDFYKEGYIPTYPLGQNQTEDFAEAFGMCNRTRITGQSGYRHNANMSYTLSPYSTNQCTAIENLLNAI